MQERSGVRKELKRKAVSFETSLESEKATG
jgi:hypothetical protein